MGDEPQSIVPISPGLLSDEQWDTLKRLLGDLHAMARAARPPEWASRSPKGWAQVDHRPHRTVLLLGGERGTGKTTVMQTLVFWADQNYRAWLQRARAGEWEQVQQRLGEAAHQLQRLRFLETIDFDPIPPGLPIAGTIVQRFERLVRPGSRGCGSPVADGETVDLRERWRELLRHTLAAYPADGVRVDPIRYEDLAAMAVDRGEQARFWLDLARHFRAFVDDLVKGLKLGDDDLLVLPIDDLDMQVRRTPETLWALSALYHPRLVFLATGDARQLETVMRLHYQGLQHELLRQAPGVDAALARTLGAAVVDKLIPPAARYQLRRVPWAVVESRLRWDSRQELHPALSELRRIVKEHQDRRSLSWRDVTQLQRLDDDGHRSQHLLQLLAREEDFDLLDDPSGRPRLVPCTGEAVRLGWVATRTWTYPVDPTARIVVATKAVLAGAGGQPVGPGLEWFVALQGMGAIAQDAVHVASTYDTPLAWTERGGRRLYWPQLLSSELQQRRAQIEGWTRLSAALKENNLEALAWAWLTWVAGPEERDSKDTDRLTYADWAIRLKMLRAAMVGETEPRKADPERATWFAQWMPVLAAPELGWPLLPVDRILREALGVWTRDHQAEPRPFTDDWLGWARSGWNAWEEHRRAVVGEPVEPLELHSWMAYRTFVEHGAAAWPRFVMGLLGAGNQPRWVATLAPGSAKQSELLPGSPNALLWFWIAGHGDVHANACTAAISRVIWERPLLVEAVRELRSAVQSGRDSMALMLVQLWRLWCQWTGADIKGDARGWLDTTDALTVRYSGPELRLAALQADDAPGLDLGGLILFRPTGWAADANHRDISDKKHVRDALLSWLGAAQTYALDSTGHHLPAAHGFERIEVTPVAVLQVGGRPLDLPELPAWGDQERGRWVWEQVVDRAQELAGGGRPDESVKRWVWTAYVALCLQMLRQGRDGREMADLPTYPVDATSISRLHDRASNVKRSNAQAFRQYDQWWRAIHPHLPDDLREALQPKVEPA